MQRRLDQLESELSRALDLSKRLDAHDAQLHQLAQVVDATNVWSAIERGTRWAAIAPHAHHPLISVVLPTRNRAEMLPVAVASVRAQSYGNWELVIVDDGSTDDTATTIAEIVAADERVRFVRTEGVGAARARNVGLDTATGSMIAFLDDDNVMTPHWLRAIAEFTGRVPGCDALYGAQLRGPSTPEAHTPIDVLFVAVFDDERLRDHNYIDLGMLAVRADHPQLRFDPELLALQDWELIMRIADVSPLTPVPALAGCYSTSAEDRISTVHGGHAAVVRMRERFAAARVARDAGSR